MNSFMGSKGPAGMNLQGNAAGAPLTGGNKIPSGYRHGQINQFTPEQQQLYQQTFGYLGPGSFLSQIAGGDQSAFAQQEAPAMRQFQELLGQNASRFSGMGLGARRGSGFQNATNAATSNFAQDLASKRQEMQRQAISDLMGFSNQLLNQRPYEQFLVEKQQKQSPWGSAIGTGLGAAAGAYFGGPQGAMTGAQIGNSIGGQF